MNRLFAIGVEVAIISFICISLFANEPLFKRGRQPAITATPPAIDVAEKQAR